MASELTPSGWSVEPDVVDEREGLPRLTGAQITALNARIAAGSKDFPVGTSVIRSDDGMQLMVQGVGTSALFDVIGLAPALLAAPGGAALVGTPTGTVQAALDARPTAAALAAADGSAGLGFLPAGAGADFRPTQDKLREISLSVTDFFANGVSGARVDPTGAIDSTAGWNVALVVLAIAAPGVGRLDVPKGTFLLDGTVSYGSPVTGLVVRGAGNGATVIKRTVDSGNVFSFTTYSRIRFEDMAFSHVTGTAYTTWTNVLFNMNGTGGGNTFQVVNCRSDGFGNIVKYNASPAANEDTNLFENCRFNNFKIFLHCLSSQAVINSVRNCTFFGTCEAVFHINGFGCTHLDTCNIVVSGKVYDVYGGGPTATYINTNCKFEFWPQGGAIGTTQLIKMNVAANVYFSFRGGGFTSSTGPDAAVNQLELMLTSGQILFEGGIWDNRIKIKTYDSMPTSVFGTAVVNGFTKFSGCTQSPSPANVTFDNSGVSPSYAGVVWENCNDRTNLCLTGISNGAAYNSTVPAESVINRNTFTGSPSGGVIMNGATPTTFPVPHHGQLAFLRSVQVLVHSQGNVNTGLISVFADAAKTISIATLALTAGVSTTPKLYSVTIPADTVISEGVYVEIKNNNGVFVYGRVYVETMSI